MATITCPYCESRANVTQLHASRVSTDPFIVSMVGRCDHCRNLVVAKRETVKPSYKSSYDDSAHLSAVFNDSEGAPTEWEPKTVLGREFPDIPEHISSPASEAFMCFSIGAYRAAVLLARSVIEAAAKDKGITSGNLYQKIDKLAEGQYIRSMLAEAAHEVRFAGNDMAHGDFATAVITEDDADELLGLMEDFLREMFELPTRVQRRKEKREASK